MALKIATTKINGEVCVNPETMDALLEMGNHRQQCEQCAAHVENKSGIGTRYCQLGNSLLEKVLNRPDVTWIPEETDQSKWRH